MKGSEDYRQKADRELAMRLEELKQKLGVRDRFDATPSANKAFVTAAATLTPLMEVVDSDKDSPRERGSCIHAGHRERLRRSALRARGLCGFSDVAVLETLLSYFIPRKDTNPVAHSLLKKYGSLLSVLRAKKHELMSVPCVTEAAAELLPLLSVIFLWDGRSEIVIRSTEDAVCFFGSLYFDERSDPSDTYVVYLDGRFGLIAAEKLKKGETGIRTAVSGVCKYCASYCIGARRLMSAEDDVFGLSDRAGVLMRALEPVGCKLLDFIVLSSFGYYSIASTAMVDRTLLYIFTPTVTIPHPSELYSVVRRMMEAEVE